MFEDCIVTYTREDGVIVFIELDRGEGGNLADVRTLDQIRKTTERLQSLGHKIQGVEIRKAHIQLADDEISVEW